MPCHQLPSQRSPGSWSGDPKNSARRISKWKFQKHFPLLRRAQRELGPPHQPHERETWILLNLKANSRFGSAHGKSEPSRYPALKIYCMHPWNPCTGWGSHDSICSQPRRRRRCFHPLHSPILRLNQQHWAPQYCSIKENASSYRILAPRVPSNLCHPTRCHALLRINNLCIRSHRKWVHRNQIWFLWHFESDPETVGKKMIVLIGRDFNAKAGQPFDSKKGLGKLSNG